MTTRIGTALPREDDATDADRQAMQQLIDRLRTDLEVVRAGGSAAAVKRHLGRGKWLARDRIRALLVRIGEKSHSSLRRNLEMLS